MKLLVITLLLCLSGFIASAQYPRIGDLIENNDGSKGVVFWVSPDGNSGWMVALHDLPPGLWGPAMVNIPALPDINHTNDYFSALSDTSGYQNTLILRQFMGDGDTYAAQKVDFEHGWYLPAAGQAHLLKLEWAQVKPIILRYGGSQMSERYYWISTEINMRDVWALGGNDEIGIGSLYKDWSREPVGIRPIRSFTNTNLTYEWSTGETTSSVTVKPNTTTDYSVTMTSAEGWSVTATRSITVNPTYLTPIQASIPNGGHYDFGGKELTAPGTYADTLTSVSGCDSIIQLTLTAHGCPYLFESNESICQGETYTFRGNTYNTTGTYDDSLKTTVTGCDSIFRLHLTVNPTYFFEESETICQGEIYNFHGRELTEPGEYYERLKTVAKCDSIYKLTLAVNPTYLSPESGTICQGEVYRFRGREFNSTGTYDDTLETVAGCDSIFRLHLTVNPTHCIESNESICQGETYTFRGNTYNTTGIYDDSLKTTVTGCDSIFRLHLTVNPTYSFEESETICQGEKYNFHGRELTEPGEYYERLKTVAGCDSIYKLTLAVNPTYLSSESGTICQGEVYRFRGREFNSTGTYDDTLETVAGCDSIFRLHLTVNPTYHPVIDTLICRGERYAENGFNETESGEYIQPLTTVHGCDSVVTLRLRVADYFDGDIEMALEDCRTHEYSFAAKNRGVADDYDYLWDFGDGNTAEEAEIVHHYADSGMYSVRLTVTAANRCAKEMSMPVQVPYFSEDFEIVAEPAEIDEAHPEIGFSTACVPGLTYLWEFGDGASGTGCKTAHQYALQEKSWYQVRLTVSNQEDCSTEEEMQIMSWSKVKSINTFSPNGDNVNDVFREGFHIKVFNRNGVLIFEGENGWDGSYKGKQVTEGVYFYEADNFSSQGARKDNGYITVIR